MKKILKVVGKTILVLFALTLTIVLVGLTTAYSCRNIAKKHINEQYIRETINKIDYGEFLKEELPMDEIKKELQESNILIISSGPHIPKSIGLYVFSSITQ